MQDRSDLCHKWSVLRLCIRQKTEVPDRRQGKGRHDSMRGESIRKGGHQEGQEKHKIMMTRDNST